MAIEFVLDTDIVLHYTRENSPVAAQVELDYGLLNSSFRPLVCAVTLGEMLSFAKQFNQDRIDKLASILSGFLVIDINRKEVLTAYSEIHRFAKSGTNIGQNDLWVAATAMAMNATVLTTDRDLLRLPKGTVKIVQVNSKTGVKERSI